MQNKKKTVISGKRGDKTEVIIYNTKWRKGDNFGTECKIEDVANLISKQRPFIPICAI